MFKRTLAAAFTVLLLLIGLSTPASAAAGGTDRPFRATATGQIRYDTGNPLGCPLAELLAPTPFTSVLHATGQATHLGAFTLSGSHCESLFQSTKGRMTLVAANGDRLYGTYATDWTVDGGQVIVDGPLVINGGTGRFTHASGTLTQHHVITLLDQQPWPLRMSFIGKISY